VVFRLPSSYIARLLIFSMTFYPAVPVVFVRCFLLLPSLCSFVPPISFRASFFVPSSEAVSDRPPPAPCSFAILCVFGGYLPMFRWPLRSPFVEFIFDWDESACQVIAWPRICRHLEALAGFDACHLRSKRVAARLDVSLEACMLCSLGEAGKTSF